MIQTTQLSVADIIQWCLHTAVWVRSLVGIGRPQLNLILLFLLQLIQLAGSIDPAARVSPMKSQMRVYVADVSNVKAHA